MSTLKVDTIDTSNSSGNITVSRPLSGSGASLTALNATELTSGTLPIARIANDAIDSQHYAAGSIDLEHMSSESVDEDNLHISNAGTNGQFLSKQSGNTGGLTWADAGVSGITDNSNAVAITINSSEFVGIGTTDPQRILSVGTHGTGNSEISMGASTSGQSGILFGDATNAVAVGYIQYQHNGNHFRIATNDAERVRIHDNGVVACAGGVALGVSTANTASNVLDDYEEGTWSPTIQDASRSDSESQAYTTQQGTYTKIGNVVTVIGRMQTSSLGSLSGNLGMGGLPFAPKSGTTGGGMLPWANGLALPSAGNTPLACSLDAGSTHCTLWQNEVTSGIGGVNTGEWSADGHVYITFTYQTD